MNERIRELIEQAGMTRILDEHAHEYGNGMFENTPYPAMDKFVELIVRECAGVSENHKGMNDKYFIADAIKKHFGVEG